MKTIPLNKPCITGNELKYLQEAIQLKKFSGDGIFTARCQNIIEQSLQAKKVFLTPSGTDSLEMAALLAGINPGDEIIMPSYTFVSTANAFLLRGASIVFVDIHPLTMNIDERLIEKAITEKTKAIVPVHYAGIACEMNSIMTIANKHGLFVIEDAAQALFSFYKGKALGTIGDFGCFSFHETKNYNCGEGGAISINKEEYISRAEIIREKGTNKSRFVRGDVDKYTWEDIGSSFLPSELQAAFLYANLEASKGIDSKRLQAWNAYYNGLKPLADNKIIDLPIHPEGCQHNAHIFYLKTKNSDQRFKLSQYLNKQNIETAFHYIPLHSSKMGRRYSKFVGEDKFTTQESEKLLRLPLYYDIQDEEIKRVIQTIKSFYA
ncbi:MAG: dTDP-4-amino-4,6-dideoxygalactose transaminase [Methylococcaceae bacterium]|nr:dTDP-4-amino-4,6-dideoxygalactose transaminase [Methylococcaceae bacterium]